MRLETRHVDNALIVDLFGDWPVAGEGKLQLGEPLRQDLEGHSGSVILHIQDGPITKPFAVLQMLHLREHARKPAYHVVFPMFGALLLIMKVLWWPFVRIRKLLLRE